MAEAQINYLGPIPEALTFREERKPWWRRLPVGFLMVVALPTLLAAIYYLLIATPRYVSEARFIVRASTQSPPSAIGMALQGVGLSTAPSDAFAVHEYIKSRDALRELGRRYDIAAILNPPGADAFSRYPRLWDSRGEEGLYTGFNRFVVVGFDSTTGISTLRVEAFRAEDARQLNQALLASGEQLVNRLNDRAMGDAVSEAQIARDEARARLSAVQQQLTAFRNREGFIDPELAARESSSLIGGLLATVAQLRADRAQLVGEAPQSPQLPILDGRIAAYERQITAERAKVAGTSTSLAPRVGIYADLELQRELADRELSQATSALLNSQQEARRQRLYLDRIVNPNLPDKPTQPRRWTAILTIFASAMLIYGVGWLVWAGVREHRQD
ncbi:chain-length determining protein [Brevundimonas sp.]|uniref:chain-length determining protein n=1 Tax=Brevundimonas sp. TaxID=1871086 RepID=UPI00286C783A|nr:chain-length determining protein [Brevundimonas sp.]